MRALLLVLFCVVAFATHAAADPAADAAARGKKAFQEERFAEAIAEFRAAHALAPDPKLLYAIAQAQRMAGDCEAAIATYEEFIATKPGKKLTEYSEANIARCREDLAKRPPPPPPEPPAPPPPTIPEPVVHPTPAAASAPAAAERRDEGRPWTRDYVGHALVIGGVAAAAVGTYLYLDGRGAAGDLNAATDHASFVEAREAADAALTKQRIGIIAGAAGAALVVGGIVHYKLGGKREARVTAVPTAGGAAVVATGRF